MILIIHGWSSYDSQGEARLEINGQEVEIKGAKEVVAAIVETLKSACNEFIPT